MTTTEQYLIPSTTSTTLTYGEITATLTTSTNKNLISVDIEALGYNVSVDHPVHGYVDTEVDVAIDWVTFSDMADAIDWAEREIRCWDHCYDIEDMAKAILMNQLDKEDPVED